MHICVGFCICSFNYEGQCEGLKLWNEQIVWFPRFSFLIPSWGRLDVVTWTIKYCCPIKLDSNWGNKSGWIELSTDRHRSVTIPDWASEVGARAVYPPRAPGGASLLKECRLYGVDWWTSSMSIHLVHITPHLGSRLVAVLKLFRRFSAICPCSEKHR